jgi:hypothetical protein
LIEINLDKAPKTLMLRSRLIRIKALSAQWASLNAILLGAGHDTG